MPQTQDYYSVLGVGRKADQKEIKAAYRHLARKYHPDVNPNNPSAADRFKEVQAAYEVLGNDDKRKLYDRFGHNWEQAQEMENAGANAAGDIGDFFTGMGGVGSFFDFFSGQPGPTGRAEQGVPFVPSNVEKEVLLTLEEVDAGTERVLTYQTLDQQVVRGQLRTAPQTKKVSLKIPKGIKDGGKLRVAGKGTSAQSGRTGDLIITVQWKHHPHFRIAGEWLETDVEVPFETAALGGDAQVPTLRGPVSVKIAAGTQSGQVLRLAGQGLSKMTGGRTDLGARVKITVPKVLTDEQRKLLEKLRDLRNGGKS